MPNIDFQNGVILGSIAGGNIQTSAPSGDIEITENGEYDVTAYETAIVNVTGDVGDGSVEHPFIEKLDFNINLGVVSNTAPENPTDQMLWLDTSVTPNVLKRYDAETETWNTIN